MSRAALPLRRLYTGRDLSRAVTIEDLRAMAGHRLPGFALEYLEGGAEEEATLARNRAAFDDWRFAPRALLDVSQRDAAIDLFGRRQPLPFAIAPTGLNGLFWAGADTKLAEAAAAAGIPFIQSTMSNDPVREVAAAPGLRHWWQLYLFGPPDAQATLIARAREAGCEALVLTTDAQVYGNREWDRRNRVHGNSLTWRAMLDAAMHPRWFATTMLGGLPRFANIIDLVPDDRRGLFASARWVRAAMRLDLGWDVLAELRKVWPRALLVKGLLRADDVRRAADAGADGVVLSNHGGRQLDGAPSPLDVLVDARRMVGRELTVIVDGGIRRGSDIVKALALGADAVLIGRAALYGLAAAGRPGVERAIDILATELDRTLALLGARDVKDLGLDLLMPSQGGGGRQVCAGTRDRRLTNSTTRPR